MSHFEFLAVMVSIILGLGIVRMLDSFDAVFSKDRYWPHALWVLTIFWLHVQNWWAFWEIRLIDFNVLHYSIWIAYASLMFLLAAALTNRSNEHESWEELFCRQRRWFFGVLVVTIVGAILISRVFYGATLLHPYRIYQFTLLAIAVFAFVKDGKQIHKAISALFMTLAICGQLVFRFMPDLFATG